MLRRKQWGRAFALSALVSVVPACGTPVIKGFPDREAYAARSESGEPTTLELVDGIEADIHRIERSIEQRADGLSGAPPEAYELVLDAFLAVSNLDETGALLDIVSDSEPIQAFPRLVTPALCREREGHWLVPLILHKRAVAPLRDSASEGDFEDPLGWIDETLSFSLRGHADADAVRIDRFRLALPSVRTELTGGLIFDLPSMGDLLGLVFRIPAGHFKPGYYWLEVTPKLGLANLTLETDARDLAGRLREGAWQGVLELTEQWLGRDESLDLSFLTDIHRLVESWYVTESADLYPGGFAEQLQRMRRLLRSYARGGGRELDLIGFRDEARALLGRNPDEASPSLAPVKLIGAEEPDRWTFVVAADLQHHDDLTPTYQFLSMLDPTLQARTPLGASSFPLGPSLRDDIENAEFVVLAGDLGDGAAGSAPEAVVLNALGLYAPRSPYITEFHELQKLFARFSKPIVAVPGNHDGIVITMGALNYAVTVVGSVGVLGAAVLFPLFAVVDLALGNHATESYMQFAAGSLRSIDAVNQWVPVLVSIPAVPAFHAYDGLEHWRRMLGLHHFSFDYYGHRFVGLNSFNLDASDRAGVGAVVSNWGGGVDENDPVWMELALRRPTPDVDSDPHTFIFMHHDPRAATPLKNVIAEREFGDYERPSPAPLIPFVPILWPAFIYGARLITEPERWQQEWLSKYRPAEVLAVLNRHVRRQNSAEDMVIFFGHDDVPVVSWWATPDGALFPERALREPPVSTWSSEVTRLPAGHNARVVRLDDVGNAGSHHGFHVVAVEGGRVESIRWVPIPR